MMDRKELLKQINNQCSVVQMAIAINYESPENEGLNLELKSLKEMIDTHFNYPFQTSPYHDTV